MKQKILETMMMRFIRYVVDWRRTRAVIRELNMLTDKQLKDIGINRGEIDYLVYTLEQEQSKGSKLSPKEMKKGKKKNG